MLLFPVSWPDPPSGGRLLLMQGPGAVRGLAEVFIMGCQRLLWGCVSAGVTIRSICGVGGDEVEKKNTFFFKNGVSLWRSLLPPHLLVAARCHSAKAAWTPPPACTPTAGDAVYCIFKAVSWNAFDEYSLLLWCIWKHAWRLHEDMLFSNRDAQVVFGKKKSNITS